MAYPEASMSWERAEEAIKRNREKKEKERQEIKRLLSIREDSREDKHIIMAAGGCGQIANHAYSVYFNHVSHRIL